MRLADIDTLRVYANMRGHRQEVGLLRAIGAGNGLGRAAIHFQYHEDFVRRGFALSPFTLALGNRPFEAPYDPFDGLHGVFADSLPDSWGRLLLDRAIRRIDPGIALMPLQRLACVGNKGMGCLEYEPLFPMPDECCALDLDGLAAESRNLLEKDSISADNLGNLLRLNGSSGGARPKILVDITPQGTILPCNSGVDNTTAWIIKFPCQHDADNIALREYVWSRMACQFGIKMPATRLFTTTTGKAYFGVQRFDRAGHHKIHVATAAGLLNADATQPCLDYENLLKLCKLLTQDINEVKKLVRVMVFNVLMNNTDDHAKNFSFVLDERSNWKFSPAYDLAPQRYAVEHMAAVNNKGRDITEHDMIVAAGSVGIDKAFVSDCVDEMREIACTEQQLLDEAQATGGIG